MQLFHRLITQHLPDGRPADVPVQSGHVRLGAAGRLPLCGRSASSLSRSIWAPYSVISFFIGPWMRSINKCELKPQLTVGTAQTENPRFTTDTRWPPRFYSEMWLRPSTSMPSSRMSMSAHSYAQTHMILCNLLILLKVRQFEAAFTIRAWSRLSGWEITVGQQLIHLKILEMSVFRLSRTHEWILCLIQKGRLSVFRSM